MTRVADAENEASLVEMARYASAAQLERICSLLRRVQRDEPIVDRRRFSVRDLGDGTVRGRAAAADHWSHLCRGARPPP